MFPVILLCLTLFTIPVMTIHDDLTCEATPSVPSYDVGDYRNCLSQLNRKVYVFEVLPIYGWDNLRNQDMGMVIAPTYTKCKLTEDGMYLLPDDVYVLPQKESRLHEFAELITHWHNYSSTTSRSINVHAGSSWLVGMVYGFKISGKFATDYLHTKSKQVMDKSYLTRVQLRYIAYKVKLQPNAALHPKFKSSVLKIARLLQMNDTFNAKYESELLVRDYGTHVVTSMDAGAAMVQEDFISKTLVLQNDSRKRDILATASANFFGLAHAGVSFKRSTSTDISNSYEQSKTSSNVNTYGGSIFMFANYTVTDWSKKLDNNLVVMDRSGTPLYYLITADNLPEVPSSLVRQVSDLVNGAIRDYYEYNTYRGCTKPESPNFSFQANVDDGNCKPPLTNMTFGGVYMTCEMEPGYTAGDICGNLREPNPKTGTYSCSSGYSTILLHKELFTRSYTASPCRKCGWFSHCCHDEYHSSTAKVTLYWCAAEGPVYQDSGYLFGGLFSSNIDNPLTQEKSCPEAFYARKFGSDLKVCISDDFEEGVKVSVPFAGFYSCNMGNPLALKKSEAKNVPLNSLNAYYINEGEAGWPKKCPVGFSAHLAIVDQGCVIHYCIVAAALSDKLPPIRLPPFSSEVPLVQLMTPEYEYKTENGTWSTTYSNIYITSPDRTTWTSISIDPSDIFVSQKVLQKADKSSITAGTASIISILATLVFVALIMVFVGVFKHYKRNKRQSNNTNYGSYGEIGSEQHTSQRS